MKRFALFIALVLSVYVPSILGQTVQANGGVNLGNGVSVKSDSRGNTLIPNINGSSVKTPEQFGAYGDDSHDDAAAINAAYASCGAATNCSVHLSAKTYKILSMIVAGSTNSSNVYGRSLTGEGIGASRIDCVPTSTITACVQFLNSPGSTLSGMTISANANATYVLEHTTTGSAEHQSVRDVQLGGGQYGWAIGPDTHLDLAHVNGDNVKVNSSVLANYLVGDGVQGNVLDNYCSHCTSDLSGGYGVLQRGGGFSAPDMAFDENTTIDWYIQNPPDQEVVFDGARSEGSKQFFKYSGVGVGFPTVRISNSKWSCGSSPNTYAVEDNSANSITIADSRFTCSNNAVSMSFGYISTSPTVVKLLHVQISNPAWGSVLAALNALPSVVLDASDDMYVDGTTYVATVGSGQSFKSSGGVYRSGPVTQDKDGNIATQGNISSVGSISNPVGGIGPYQNLIRYSQFESGNPAWDTSFCNGPTPPALTPNAVAGPFPWSGTTALKITVQAVTATGCSFVVNTIKQTVSLTTGLPYVHGLWMKGDVGGESVVMGTSVSSNINYTLTTSWKFYSFESVATSGMTFPGAYIAFATPGSSVYLWGDQFEQAFVPGMYFHTLGTAQALAQGLVIAGATNSATGSLPHVTDTSGGTKVAVSIPVQVDDGTGNGGAAVGGFGPAPTASTSTATMHANSTTSRWQQNPAATGETVIPGVPVGGIPSGHLAIAAPDTFDLVDGGAMMSPSAPSLVADSSAGSAPTLTLISGATDRAGWVSLVEGTSPNTSAGLITVQFGGAYATAPKCDISPANAAAAALNGTAQPYVAQSGSTSSQFVIYQGSTALVSGTTYVWRYSCAL